MCIVSVAAESHKRLSRRRIGIWSGDARQTPPPQRVAGTGMGWSVGSFGLSEVRFA